MRFDMFLDERPEELEANVRFTMSAVVCEEARWRRYAAGASKIGAMRRRRRLVSIDGFLQSAAARAIIAFADVPKSIAIAGEVDGTSDIPHMSRMDNLWSCVFLGLVTFWLGRLCGAGVTAADIRVFYDAKTITEPHRKAMRAVLDRNLPRMASETARGSEASRTSVVFSRFEQVPKPGRNESPTALRHGVNVAHHLCSQSAEALATSTLKSIEVANLTTNVREMIEPFLTPVVSERPAT